MIDELLHAGMDVARLNFSHGTPERQSSVGDLRSPRLRAFTASPLRFWPTYRGQKSVRARWEQGKSVRLHFGQRFVITTKNVIGTEQGVSTTFRALPESVRKGDRVLLNDGEIALRVVSSRGQEVVCQVENGGELANIRASIFLA